MLVHRETVMTLNVGALQDLYDMLLALEWERYEEADGGPLFICPVCGRYKAEGHAADCALSTALRKAESPG